MVYASAVPNGTASGTPITAEGMTSGGIFVDDQQGIDYLSSRLQEAVFGLLVSTPKVPFTAKGIDRLIGAARGTLHTLSAPPYAIIDEEFTVEATAIGDVSTGDLTARYLDALRFGASTQGGIHAVKIDGSIAP